MQVLRRRRGFTWIELVAVLAIVFILAAIALPLFIRAREPVRPASCQSNLKQIGLGFLQYAQDNNERWPLVASNAVGRSVEPFETPYGWADALQPYLKSTRLLQCTSHEPRTPGVDAVQAGFTDYWMNLNMSRAEVKNLQSPAQSILCGEGNDGRDGTDARYARNVLPQFWLADEKSPARRHLDMMTLLFADGHVKGVKARQVTTGAPSLRSSASAYTFAVKWRQ